MANRSRTARGRAAKLGALHSPLAQVVAGEIRERILAGRFSPGERLAEEPLSEELGVSRMPVREALRLLSAEGIVILEPRRGASVASYTAEQVQELVEVRATLEGLNARLAARRHDPAQIAKLEKIVADGSRINERTELSVILDENGIMDAVVVGLAGDWCVKATAIDGVRLGYGVTVPLHLTRFVELNPGDSDRAVEEMRAAGVAVTD